jgi:phage terminase small subunit
MSRLPTPTAILDAKGSYIHNPQLRRPDEPKIGKSIGPPPKWLAENEKVVWRDLVKQCAPGVLTYSDRNAFEMLVVLTASFRERSLEKTSDMTIMINLCAHFGMTPSSRSKIVVPAAPKSKLDAFLSKPVAKRPSAPPAPRPIFLDPSALPN